MLFNDHSKLAGLHSFLSASKNAWVNYDDDKLTDAYINFQAAARGTRLHAFAKECIELGQKLPRSRQTLCMYVNDAIGYRMTPEQVLYYSENAFGTADAISFKNNLLRIHDLKTGVSHVSLRQLEVYAAFFCLEYDVHPSSIDMELRIYQNDEVLVHVPEADVIRSIMDRIISADKQIELIKSRSV